MARPVGVEPTTFWSVAKRSIQLSNGRTKQEHIKYIIKSPKIQDF